MDLSLQLVIIEMYLNHIREYQLSFKHFCGPSKRMNLPVKDGYRIVHNRAMNLQYN